MPTEKTIGQGMKIPQMGVRREISVIRASLSDRMARVIRTHAEERGVDPRDIRIGYFVAEADTQCLHPVILINSFVFSNPCPEEVVLAGRNLEQSFPPTIMDRRNRTVRVDWGGTIGRRIYSGGGSLAFDFDAETFSCLGRNDREVEKSLLDDSDSQGPFGLYHLLESSLKTQKGAREQLLAIQIIQKGLVNAGLDH